MKSIAIFEALKGLAVLLAGLGLLRGLHEDWQAVANGVIAHLHLDPSHHVAQVFVRAFDGLSPERIRVLAAIAAVYSTFRFVEAYGL